MSFSHPPFPEKVQYQPPVKKISMIIEEKLSPSGGWCENHTRPHVPSSSSPHAIFKLPALIPGPFPTARPCHIYYWKNPPPNCTLILAIWRTIEAFPAFDLRARLYCMRNTPPVLWAIEFWFFSKQSSGIENRWRAIERHTCVEQASAR